MFLLKCLKGPFFSKKFAAVLTILVILVTFTGCAVRGYGKWYDKNVSESEEQAMNPCVTFHTFKF